MKRLALTVAFLLCGLWMAAQAEKTASPAGGRVAPDLSVPFASYPEGNLELDVYFPDDDAESHWCIIYTYGGGFVSNNQRGGMTQEYCRKLADNGYVVIASDYRLGLKGVRMKGLLSMVKPMRKAVRMACEDILKATAYVLEHSSDLKVRKDGIILCGSSAGAITSLQCDYEQCNRTAVSEILPEDFHYAGIISFAGAVFSDEGRCDYRKHSPAPTLLLHGIDDRLVVYDRIAFFKMRLSGSNDLQKRFAKYGWSHEIIRFKDEGHGVAMRMMESFDDVMWFLDNMVKNPGRLEIDKTVNDKDHVRTVWDKSGPETMFGS